MITNTTGGTLLQEAPIHDGIVISISEYQLCEAPQVTHSITSEQNAMSKYESVKLSIYIDLNVNSLVTGININYADTDLAVSSFKFLEIEHCGLEDTNWIKSVGVQENPQSKDADMNFFHPEKSLRISCYGAAKSLRISFLALKKNLREHTMRTQVERNFNEQHSRSQFNDTKNLRLSHTRGYDREDFDIQGYDEDEYEWKVFLANCFSSIQVMGYSLYTSPTASQVMSLLNITNILRKSSRNDEAIESEILFGLALINARRFLQAAEILRKVSDYFVSKSDISKKDIISKGRSTTPSSSRQDKKDFTSTSLLNNTPSREQTTVSLTRAAKIEIIISDAIIQHSMITRKVEALQKASEYFLGQRDTLPSSVGYNYDIYTALLKLSPVLSKLLVKCLNDKLEPLRMAAIRTLEFLLDLLGSSMGPYLPHILKHIFLTYPNQSFLNLDSNRENFGMADLNPLDVPLNNSSTKKKDGKGGSAKRGSGAKGNNQNMGIGVQASTGAEQNYVNFKAMTDVYNHMLETFLNFLPNLSSQTLQVIFHDLILPNLFLPELTTELRSYLFRIAERIINLCEGDLSCNVSFFANLLGLFQINHPSLKNVGQKLWDAIKAKIIYNMENKAMDKFINWISESLYTLAESENTDDQSLLHFQYLLDLIAVICSREGDIEDEKAPSTIQRSQFQKRNLFVKEPLNLQNLLNPLLIWLEKVVNNPENKVDLFHIIWVVINELIHCLPKQSTVSLNDIALPLLWRVSKHCETSSPTAGMLNFLITVLSSLKDTRDQMGVFLKEFTPIFSNCIPHSIYDESFEVFDILMQLAAPLLDEDIIRRCISALLDQYTMKGKAYKQTKDAFIKQIVNQQQQHGPRDVRSDLLYITLKVCLLENPEPFENPEVQFTLMSFLSTNQVDPSALNDTKQNAPKAFDSKQFSKLYEDFLDRLQFADEVFRQARESNFAVIYLLVSEGVIQSNLERLICSGNSKVRSKAMDILRAITEIFVLCKDFRLASNRSEKNAANIIEEASLTFAIPDFETITSTDDQNKLNTTKAVFARMSLSILKLAFEQFQDPKIQFFGLALLAKVFDNFLPPPSVSEELDKFNSTKKQIGNRKIDISELENLSYFSNYEVSFDDEMYLHYRLNFILRFWPQVQALVQSPWSNIKVLSQTLISMWAKPDFNSYVPSQQKRVKSYLFTLLMSLLTSKEAELRYWGLMTLGSLCGMNHNFDYLDDKLIENLSFFQRLSNTVSVAIWETVYNLQKDWNTSNKDAAVVLIQLAAPKEVIHHFYKVRKEGFTLKYNSQTHNSQSVSDNTNKFNLTALSQFMNAKDGKNMPVNYNEESSLNFSHMLKNINANVGSKFDSPVETGKSGFANQHPSIERSHKLPDFTSSHIMEADNQSSGFRSIRSSSSDDEPDDLFWLEYCPVETIKEALSLFRLDLKFPQNYWTDKLNESYYKNSDNTDGNDDMYDKLYIEADEVDSPGTYKIVGHPNLLQKLNKPGRPLEEEIDLEELGIIELEEEDELIDDVEHEPETSKKFGKNRPASSGRSKLSQTIKVRPNSPQGRNNNEQIIQEYLAQNLMNAKEMYNNDGYQEEYNDVHIEDHHIQGAANPLEKVALRPHNPVYRPLTPPVRNLTPSNAMRGDQQQQQLYEGNINQTATSKIAKAFHQSTDQFADNRRGGGGSKLLKASPSAINLNLDGENSQPSSGGPSAKTSVMYYENVDEGYPYTNFEQEPGQLEGDVIFLNPRHDGFNSPKQIVKKHGHGHGHGHSQEMFIGDRSDDVFSFKGRSSEKTQHLSFGGSNDDFSNREIMKEQKSRYKAEMGDYHSSGGHSEEGLSARTNSPVDENDQEDHLEPAVEDKKGGQIEVDVSTEKLNQKVMKNPIKSPLEGVNKAPTAVENKNLRASKDLKKDLERMSAEQADTINLVRRNLGTIEAQNEPGKKHSDEYINVHDDSALSSEENPEQVHLLSQKYSGTSYLHGNQYFDDYEDLSSTNQQMMTLKNLTSHYQKPGPYTAPLNNNYLIKDHYDDGSQDKLLQPKSEGNSLASLQVNQFNTINQKELSAAIKGKKKAPASRFSDYGQVSNVLKENKRSSSNPKAVGSQQKKLSERRKNPLGHASVHNYSQNTSQNNSGQEKSSPTRKDNMMKNILKKAVHILKHDQRDSHSFADRHEKAIKKSSWYANESMDASSTNDVYGILPKEREKSGDNKRSVSAEKGNVKYFNLPVPAGKNPLDISGRLSQHKQTTSKLEKKTPKMSSQSGSHKKGPKGEWVKDERVFFPKRVTPSKNNRDRGSHGFAGEVLEDISNQTM